MERWFYKSRKFMSRNSDFYQERMKAGKEVLWEVHVFLIKHMSLHAPAWREDRTRRRVLHPAPSPGGRVFSPPCDIHPEPRHLRFGGAPKHARDGARGPPVPIGERTLERNPLHEPSGSPRVLGWA